MSSAVIPAGSMDNWYSRVKEEITKQQEDPVWMSEDQVIRRSILTALPSIISSLSCDHFGRHGERKYIWRLKFRQKSPIGDQQTKKKSEVL